MRKIVSRKGVAHSSNLHGQLGVIPLPVPVPAATSNWANLTTRTNERNLRMEGWEGMAGWQGMAGCPSGLRVSHAQWSQGRPEQTVVGSMSVPLDAHRRRRLCFLKNCLLHLGPLEERDENSAP